MHVVGTAGHVDHGKSTLVEALTGIDPDRLKEEKEREMTIDLGFAWLKPGEGQEEIGIVDVPGHRDFIENMLAGVGGIDLALLVIAADEGVMPQTREHLAILDLLEIPAGIIVLTKADLVDDPDWIELVILDIYETLKSTPLADAPLYKVSAITGAGIDELRNALIDQLKTIPVQVDEGQPRLPIDRIFSLPGFGTIVTGTLAGGSLQIGDAIEIQPGGKKGRIRGLQTHKTKREVASPGSRVAVNITGLAIDDIRRGNVLSLPGTIGNTLLCDVKYRHLPDNQRPLKHNEEVKLFVGAAEVMARVRVLGEKVVLPGEHGWLQLALKEPIALSRGDRFILRRPSPAETVGGGQVIDPLPGRKYRRFKPEIISRLEDIAEASPGELMLDYLRRAEPLPLKQLLSAVDLDNDEALAVWTQLIDSGKALEINSYALSISGWDNFLNRLIMILRDYHANNPLRLGIPREEARSRLRVPQVVFGKIVTESTNDGRIVEEGKILRLQNHHITLNPEQKRQVNRIRQRLTITGVNSPSVKEIKSEIGLDVYNALIDLGELFQISEDVVYQEQDYRAIISQITGYIRDKGQANAAQVRDLLHTSRKYAIALLEHMDDQHITRRDGDFRLLR